MCGILGELTFRDQLMSSDNFKRILKLSESRGPDNTSMKTVGERLRFGFNRLSVMDTSINANQPMWSPTKRYLIVYNGEIYNHLDLRNNLPKKGAEIKSHGDTATIACCIEEWGIRKVINQLDGMFAIGIWDQHENCLSLVRDFAGIKPLFYGWNGKTLVFASQYNQVSRHPAFHNEPINQKVLKLYLAQHFVPPPYGILRNTYSVSPGEIITFHMDGKKDSVKYWDFPEYYKVSIKEYDAVKQVYNGLHSAVQAELMSDVPLGAFLSGGVDSPLVCYHACYNNFNDFETFSMGSDSLVHDESYLSSQYAESLGTKHHTVKMNANNSLDALEKAVAAAGEPIGDLSILPTWEVSKLASSRVTVALSGDGGDELFFGYERFRSIAKNHWLWSFPYPLRFLIRGLDRMFVNDKYVNECVLAKTPGEAHFGLHSRFPIGLIEDLVPSLSNISLPENFDTYEYSKPREIDEVVLVGGQTRMPKVQEMVKKIFGKEAKKGVNPDEVVAIGASVQGAILSGDQDVKDILLLDVTPLSLGIETLGGIFTRLIDRNTTIPARQSKIFTTAEDNQSSVDIHVLQGERQQANYNKTIGRFHLDGLPSAPRNSPQIDVGFDIDANGILSVSARDMATGNEQKIAITTSSGLSSKEIQQMIQDAEANIGEDEFKRKEFEIRHKAETLIYETKKKLSVLDDKLDLLVKSDVESAVVALQQALERKVPLNNNSNIELIHSQMDLVLQIWQKLWTNFYVKDDSNEQSVNFVNANYYGICRNDPADISRDHQNESHEEFIDADYEVVDNDDRYFNRRN